MVFWWYCYLFFTPFTIENKVFFSCFFISSTIFTVFIYFVGFLLNYFIGSYYYIIILYYYWIIFLLDIGLDYSTVFLQVLHVSHHLKPSSWLFAFFTILAFHTIFTLHKRISTRESKELFISPTRSTNLKEYLMLNVKWHSLNFSAVLNDHLWSVFDFFLILPILIDHFGIYKHCLKVIKNHKRLL